MTGIGNYEYPPQWWEPSTSQVSYHHDRSCLTIQLAGELDAFNGAAAYRQARDILITFACNRVILDLANLDFCDCAGVRILIAMHYLATDRGGACEVHNPQDHVAWLLRELRLPGTLGFSPPRPPSRRRRGWPQPPRR
jgi:anti-anti-sigma factor